MITRHIAPKYYKLVEVRRKFGAVFDHKGEEVNERERGLDEECALYGMPSGEGHGWIKLPHEEGQKEYLKCLHCEIVSHF